MEGNQTSLIESSDIDIKKFSGKYKKIIRDKVFKLANEALSPSLKDLARQGLISFTKHKRPISSEDLEVLYAANQLGLNAPESFANYFEIV